MALKHGIHSPWMMEHLSHRGVMITSVFLNPFTLEKIYIIEKGVVLGSCSPLNGEVFLIEYMDMT